MAYMFANTESFDMMFPDWNVENVMTMEFMFSNTESFAGLSLRQWNVTNETDITGMLCNASGINPFVLPKWRTDDTRCP